jgi:predicted Zn-dependent peptidase
MIAALAVAGLASLVLASAAHAQSVEVEEYVLDNGMTFLLVPRYEEPNTISAGWVAKVGSVNERPGITGISHFFEHMMFKGTTTIGTEDVAADEEFMRRQKEVKDRINDLIWKGQYARYLKGEIDDPWDAANDTDELKRLRAELRDLMERHREIIKKNEFDQTYTNAGASGMNAFTSHDMTFYFINVPSNKFELWAWMESDRLNDSVFREFYAERDVVHEERRMRLESSPTGELDEQFDAMFWQASPYSWSVIGWPTDLNSYTREEFDAYFNVYYRPNNLVGIVVGDFQPEEVKSTIREYFGRLQRGTEEPPPVVTLEVEQIAEKRMYGECDCQPQVEVRYHTVGFNHRDSFALDVLSEILNGRTGRLYKSMIEGEEIASSATATQNSMKYGGFFSFRAEIKGDATPGDLERAWYAQLARLQNEPVTDHELQKVKNQVSADSYRRLQRNNALLFQLGMYEAMGEWEYINEAPDKMLAVTADDIMRVANTYFAPTNRNVAVFTRRAGSTAVSGAIPDSIPAEMHDQLRIFMDEIQKYDANSLTQLSAQLTNQLEMVPPQYKPALEFMLQKVAERLASLEGGDE